MHLSLSGESRNPIGSVADLRMLVGVGFGVARIYKGSEVIYDEHEAEDSDYYPLSHFEGMAQLDPDHVWKCVMEDPLWNATWERQETNKWTCVSSGMGFA